MSVILSSKDVAWRFDRAQVKIGDRLSVLTGKTSLPRGLGSK